MNVDTEQCLAESCDVDTVCVFDEEQIRGIKELVRARRGKKEKEEMQETNSPLFTATSIQ